MTVPLNKICAFKISAEVRAVPYLLQATDDHVPTYLLTETVKREAPRPRQSVACAIARWLQMKC